MASLPPERTRPFATTELDTQDPLTPKISQDEHVLFQKVTFTYLYASPKKLYILKQQVIYVPNRS